MTQAHQTRITFLGTSAAVPDPGSDTASFLINDRILVDTGWSVVDNLQKAGVNPIGIDYVLFTHFHHDHYVSLPSLLFYWMMRGKGRSPLRLIGPAGELELVVERALAFLQADRFFAKTAVLELIPLSPGENYEEETFQISTCSTLHPVPGLCFKFTDRITGKTFSFTGDTAPHPPLIEHIRGSELLITEASLGPGRADSGTNASLHSGALDAAELAERAKVGRLLLVHGRLAAAQQCVEAAGQLFSGPVVWPKDGQTIILE